MGHLGAAGGARRSTRPQSQLLLDPARTAGVRTRVDFTVDAVDRCRPAGSTPTAPTSAPCSASLGADATAVGVTQVLPDGETPCSLPGDTDPQGDLGPGESITLERAWTVPVPAARGRSETDAGYLSPAGRARRHAAQRCGVRRWRRAASVASSHRCSASATTRAAAGRGRVHGGREGRARRHQRRLRPATWPTSARSTPRTSSVEAIAGSSRTHGHRCADRARGRCARAAPRRRTPPPLGRPAPWLLRGTATWKDPEGNTYGATGSDLDRASARSRRSCRPASSTPSWATSATTARSRPATRCATPSPSATQAASR